MKHEKEKLWIKKELKKIKLRQLFALIAVIVAIFYIIKFQHMDSSRMLIIIGIALFFTSFNWRCPCCGQYLSHAPFSSCECKNCGTELK